MENEFLERIEEIRKEAAKIKPEKKNFCRFGEILIKLKSITFDIEEYYGPIKEKIEKEKYIFLSAFIKIAAVETDDMELFFDIHNDNEKERQNLDEINDRLEEVIRERNGLQRRIGQIKKEIKIEQAVRGKET